MWRNPLPAIHKTSSAGPVSQPIWSMVLLASSGQDFLTVKWEKSWNPANSAVAFFIAARSSGTEKIPRKGESVGGNGVLGDAAGVHRYR